MACRHALPFLFVVILFLSFFAGPIFTALLYSGNSVAAFGLETENYQMKNCQVLDITLHMRNVTCNGDDPLLTMTNRKRQLSSSSSSSSKKSCSPARYIRYVYKVTPVAFKNNFDNTASVNDAKTNGAACADYCDFQQQSLATPVETAEERKQRIGNNTISCLIPVDAHWASYEEVAADSDGIADQFDGLGFLDTSKDELVARADRDQLYFIGMVLGWTLCISSVCCIVGTIFLNQSLDDAADHAAATAALPKQQQISEVPDSWIALCNDCGEDETKCICKTEPIFAEEAAEEEKNSIQMTKLQQ